MCDSTQTNTYQAVLTTDGSQSFVMFHYGNLTWTTGELSGGDPITGLGGTPAVVSYKQLGYTAEIARVAAPTSGVNG